MKIHALTFQGKKDKIVREEFLMLLEIEKLNLKKGLTFKRCSKKYSIDSRIYFTRSTL